MKKLIALLMVFVIVISTCGVASANLRQEHQALCDDAYANDPCYAGVIGYKEGTSRSTRQFYISTFISLCSMIWDLFF